MGKRRKILLWGILLLLGLANCTSTKLESAVQTAVVSTAIVETAESVRQETLQAEKNLLQRTEESLQQKTVEAQEIKQAQVAQTQTEEASFSMQTQTASFIQTAIPTVTVEVPDIDWHVSFSYRWRLDFAGHVGLPYTSESGKTYHYYYMMMVTVLSGGGFAEIGYYADEFRGDKFSSCILNGLEGAYKDSWDYQVVFAEADLDLANAYMSYRDKESELDEKGTLFHLVAVRRYDDGSICYYPDGEGALGIQEEDGTYNVYKVSEIPWVILTPEEISLVEEGYTFLVRDENGTSGRCPISGLYISGGGVIP